jgi:hypothetical protein
MILIGMAMASASFAAEEATPFRFWREIKLAKTTGDEIVAFDLDSLIYAETRDGLPDLRVLDDHDTGTPYKTELNVEYSEQRSRQAFPTVVTSLRENGGAVEILLQLPEHHPAAEGLGFSTPLKNYERKVKIFGSNDGAAWKPLTDGVIFDYSRFMDVHSDEIALPKNDFRRFKIVVEDVTDDKESPYKELTRTFHGKREDERVERTTIERRPFRIDRINAWNTAVQQHVRQTKRSTYAPADFGVKQDAAKKQTVVTIRTHREPVDLITLKTSSRNFSRQATIEVAETRGKITHWQTIGGGALSSYRFRSYQSEQLSLHFPETREATYRIVIANEDNPPLSIESCKLEGNNYRVVFLTQESKKYRVYYGSETAAAPKYEATEVLSTLQHDYQPVMAKLGPVVANDAFRAETTAASPNYLNNKVFLGTAIVLMVAVLTWALFYIGRRLEQLPPE